MKEIKVNGFTTPMLTWGKSGLDCGIEVKRRYSDNSWDYLWTIRLFIFPTHKMYKKIFNAVNVIEKTLNRQLDGFYIGEETDKMRVKQNFIYDLFCHSIFDGRIDYFKVKDKFAVIGVNYHHEYDYDYKESEMHEGVFSDAVKILEFAEGLSK